MRKLARIPLCWDICPQPCPGLCSELVSACSHSVRRGAISLPQGVSLSDSPDCLSTACLPAPCLLFTGRWNLGDPPPRSPPRPPTSVAKMPHEELVFCPRQGGSGNRDVCSGCGCMRIGQGSLGLGGDRQAGCWASQAGRGPQGEPWWRWRFPALGVGLSSCFLLIERSDNAVVTQLPPPSMDNSRFVRVS